MSNTTDFAGLSRPAVAAALSPEGYARVRQIDHGELLHGAHWVMRDTVVYTAAGLVIILDGLRQTHPGEALALQGAIEQARAKADAEARIEAQDAEAARRLQAVDGPVPSAAAPGDAGAYWWQRD